MLIEDLLRVDLEGPLPGLRWLSPNGCTLISIYDTQGSITGKQLAILVTGDLRFDDIPEVKPMVAFNVGDIFGILVEFEPNGDEKQIVDHVRDRIATAIDLVKKAKHPGLPGSDPAMDACWRM